jgi:site-specific DNA-methyltransferase (adenine-specific)
LSNDPGTGSGWDKNQGRWPANLIHDGSEEVVSLFPHTTSGKQARGGHVRNSEKHRNTYAPFRGQRCEGNVLYGDNGSAARFFYCAKASRKERTANGAVENNHPTVKPLALLRYLCRITKTPTGGVILDPFMGSGSTLRAAVLEGRDAIGIDISEEYVQIATDLLKADAPLFNQVVMA